MDAFLTASSYRVLFLSGAFGKWNLGQCLKGLKR